MTTDIYTHQNIDYTHPTKHNLYGTWANIKSRCYNLNTNYYKNYGAIGITMFWEWLNDSIAFLKWIDTNLRNET